MSGRAGRRGLDDRGIVILMMDGRLDPAAAKQLLQGAPDPLNSEFHLGYNMLLNLATRSDAASAEELLRRSFRHSWLDTGWGASNNLAGINHDHMRMFGLYIGL
eukprot:scaffold127839_cov32-Prasinocladus_malaysianus.AAC.1